VNDIAAFMVTVPGAFITMFPPTAVMSAPKAKVTFREAVNVSVVGAIPAAGTQFGATPPIALLKKISPLPAPTAVALMVTLPRFSAAERAAGVRLSPTALPMV
jgi:hypothetical protein